MNDAQQVLIVDDEPDIRELLEITLTRMGLHTRSAGHLAEARGLLSQHSFDLCLTDMRLPDGSGIELIRSIQQQYPHLPVAMITAHGNMESAIEALKAGAFDFVAKPVDLQILRNLVNAALQLTRRRPDDNGGAQLTLLGDSQVMQGIRRTIDKLARSQAPVYISGESGVGKELVARLIHDKGPRRDKPFVAVNCGAIPTELMESEFFGHKKGSFTGAMGDKHGLFAAAEDGTLFLDEVADLPMHMQVKLLRAIQEKAIRPIGANQEIPINVRILSATHKDLAGLVHQTQFRQDLFYRINVIELHVPSLRERTDDIPQLAEFFVHKIAHGWQSRPPQLNADALQALIAYPFPGNVRELENILERAMTLCEGNSITSNDLQLPAITGRPSANGTLTATGRDSLELDPTLYEKEREVIMRALEKTRFNKTAAAKLLGISFRALRYRIKKLGID
ncbi:MAG: sigma-54-dependent Fis family transcriptional regulator [Gammaproteobacteria bacterium]|nr:sigma-54-dependent Fis family transcriptional regulator [Gammaproteobacteria bacterium]